MRQAPTQDVRQSGATGWTGEPQIAWSAWSRCESSFSLMLAPSQPGVFAVAEEVVSAEENPAGKRILALLHVAIADDLARELGRLFSAASPLRDRLLTAPCYLRFAVVTDTAQRQAIGSSLQTWLAAYAEAASELTGRVSPWLAGPAGCEPAHLRATDDSSPTQKVADPAPLPAGF